MEKRAARVSEAQWNILLEFLKHNPALAKSRGYNNSARGRAESLHLWKKAAKMLNAERSGTTKTPKHWSTYISNFKSRLKTVVARPQERPFSSIEKRFMAILGPEFVRTSSQEIVDPLVKQEPSASVGPQTKIEFSTTEDEQQNEDEDFETNSPSSFQTEAPTTPPLPRRTRRVRYRSRPLAPLDEARRILSQVELQRVAADAANAQALNQIAHNLGRLADAFERYLNGAAR